MTIENSQTAPTFILGLYVDAYAPLPQSAAWPLDETLWKQHTDTGDLVTFAAVVPLKELLRGEDALEKYCMEAFGGEAIITGAEFRAIGCIQENAEFSEQFVGDVTLQVTCFLQSASPVC